MKNYMNLLKYTYKKNIDVKALSSTFKISPSRGRFRWSILSFFLILLTMLMGCSDDKIAIEDPESPDSSSSTDLFLYVNVELPSGASTRSETTGTGGASSKPSGEIDTEDGQGDENTISNVILYFFNNPSGEFLVSINEFEAASVTSTTGKVTLKAKVNPSKLLELCEKKTYLYIVANNSIYDSNTFNGKVNSAVSESKFSITALDKAPIGQFLYDETTGKALYDKRVPIGNKNQVVIDFGDLKGRTIGEVMKSLESVTGYSKDDRTLDLSEVIKKDDNSSSPAGTILLERGVARVDFKPYRVVKPKSEEDSEAKAIDDEDKGYYPENVYPVGKIPNLFAKITTLQIFNVSKSSFLFRHTSSGNKTIGYPSGETLDDDYTGSLFGIERGNNYGKVKDTTTEPDGSEITTYDDDYYWITDTDWKTKSDKALTGPAGSYFLNQPVKIDVVTGLTDYYRITDTKGTFDVSRTSVDKDEWYSWCYISENTLPSTAAMTKGLCTGISFKMLLCDETGEAISNPQDKFIDVLTFNKNETEYNEASKAWEDGKKAWDADQEKKKEADQSYEMIPYPETKPINANNGKVVGSLKQIGNTNYYKLVVGAAETICEKKDDGFEMIYYYFFRHNLPTPHVTGTVEPMQFAVVRNNIYKIRVTSLNSIPEPFKPGDPAEPQEEYISVELNILSWAREDREWEL